MTRRLLTVSRCLLLSILPALPAGAGETVDLATIHRIKQEAFSGSKVMDHLFFLTDVNGPRLTASPGQRAAADWAVRSLREWGIGSARLEKWGRFGRGWALERFSMNLEKPTYAPIPGIPKACRPHTRKGQRGSGLRSAVHAGGAGEAR